MKDLKTISKFISLVLRHKPETIGLVLDKNGYANVQELIQKSNYDFDFKTLVEVVETNNKQRFSFNEDRTLIRANQGHSINVDLELTSQQPPNILYHGTATRFLDSIRDKGLIPNGRQHVHLSKDRATAINVGSRHGTPIVLLIDALQMFNAGHKFFCSENGVWLTQEVPLKYIRFYS